MFGLPRASAKIPSVIPPVEFLVVPFPAGWAITSNALWIRTLKARATTAPVWHRIMIWQGFVQLEVQDCFGPCPPKAPKKTTWFWRFEMSESLEIFSSTICYERRMTKPEKTTWNANAFDFNTSPTSSSKNLASLSNLLSSESVHPTLLYVRVAG